MMKIRLALVAACLLVHLFGQADKLGIEGNTILVQYLCLGQTVRLQTLTDLESLSAERCRDPVIKNALDDLKEMVRELRICTMDKAKKITSFYETYLSKRKPAIATDPVNEAQLLKETPPTPDQSEFRDESPDDLFSDSSNKNNDEIAQGPSSRLPDELVDFAIAYGMKVSGKCREYLFFTLKYLTKIGLGRGDFMALNEWTNNKSPVARILAPITKHGDFLLPSDFSAHLPSMEEHYKITVEPKNLNNLKVAQWVCINRFRPLYEPIVMPIAHLARHGLTYNLYRMRKELALSWGTRRLLTKWSRIVFVCEYMKNANFGLDDKINAVKYFDTTPDFITVRPEERHEPGLMFLEETVLAPSERGKLRSAIAKYDARLSEAERFRKRLISNRWKLLMSAFESKEKWQTLIDGAISMYKRDRSDSNMSEELKLAINNLEKTAGEGKESRVISILFKLYQVGDATIRGVGCLFDNLIYIILTEIIKTFPDADRRATTF